MNLGINSATGHAFDPTHRGYAPLYRADAHNHCPGCGRSHWIIGRMMAECAFCETALPLERDAGAGSIRRFAIMHAHPVGRTSTQAL